MKSNSIIKGMFLMLTGTVILLSLVPPAIAIDHPVGPFQTAKAMVLREGTVHEGKTYGEVYILAIWGWGAIMYTPQIEYITLMKGTLLNKSSVIYDGRYQIYSISRVIEGRRPEMTTTDWLAAMQIAYKYLQEIETVRRK